MTLIAIGPACCGMMFGLGKKGRSMIVAKQHLAEIVCTLRIEHHENVLPILHDFVRPKRFRASAAHSKRFWAIPSDSAGAPFTEVVQLSRFFREALPLTYLPHRSASVKLLGSWKRTGSLPYRFTYCTVLVFGVPRSACVLCMGSIFVVVTHSRHVEVVV